MHGGTEGEQRHICTHSATDGGGWSTPRPGRFTPGEETGYPLYRRMHGGPAPACTNAKKKKMFFPDGVEFRNVQPVSSRYIDCGIPALDIMKSQECLW